MNEFLEDTFAGCVSGVTFVLSAHPFEYLFFIKI